jgi:S-adenosylmethionine/arginine decarboxylase-like enzyme
VESLGYGTLLIIDGFNANSKTLTNRTTIETCLNEIAALLESHQEDLLSIEDATGISATLRLAESHLSLHTFSNSGSLSLRIFSRHDMRLGEITSVLEKHFAVGRIESYLSNRSKTMPLERNVRERVLLGDRAYTALRLDEILEARSR